MMTGEESMCADLSAAKRVLRDFEGTWIFYFQSTG